jgi:membrane-bound lytic murein transglycosylase D
MAERRIGMTLLVGGCLLAFGGMTAWSIGREPGDAATPMDEVIARTSTTWDLPATRNDAVENWIDYLSNRNADKTRLWMERSGKYAPMIRAELRRRGMPEDLLYLAFIESGFTPRAYSSAAASGIWQFIAETGRRYGLEVNSEVDERRDPLKSTGAALDYLQELHDEFGSWYLAAAAYNSGENRIARIMREHTGSVKGDDAAFWKIAPYLPKETRNYVPLMLAAGYINKQPEAHGFTEVEYQDPLQFEVAWVPGGTPLTVVAKAAGVTDSAVKDLNPHLMQGHTPFKRGWAVRIPSGTKTAFDQRFSNTYAMYRATAAVNNSSSSKSSKSKPSKSKASKSVYHVVARGENLSAIGDRYNVTVKKLKSMNGLRSSVLQPGQKLRVRA